MTSGGAGHNPPDLLVLAVLVLPDDVKVARGAREVLRDVTRVEVAEFREAVRGLTMGSEGTTRTEELWIRRTNPESDGTLAVVGHTAWRYPACGLPTAYSDR